MITFRQGTFLQPRLDPEGVGQLLQGEDPFAFLPRDAGHERLRPRSQDEDIVGQGLAAGQADPPRLRVDLLHAGVDPDVDPRLPELLGRACDQPFLIFDYITDVIGHRSGGHRDLRPLLDHDDLERRILPFRLGGHGGAPGPRPDNHDMCSHCNSLSYSPARSAVAERRMA